MPLLYFSYFISWMTDGSDEVDGWLPLATRVAVGRCGPPNAGKRSTGRDDEPHQLLHGGLNMRFFVGAGTVDVTIVQHSRIVP